MLYKGPALWVQFVRAATYTPQDYVYFSDFISDVDECTLGVDKCSSPSSCLNTPGYYMCICPEGYTGSGYPPVTCTEIPPTPTPTPTPQPFPVPSSICSYSSLNTLSISNWTCIDGVWHYVGVILYIYGNVTLSDGKFQTENMIIYGKLSLFSSSILVLTTFSAHDTIYLQSSNLVINGNATITNFHYLPLLILSKYLSV